MIVAIGLLWLIPWNYYDCYHEIAMVATIIATIITTIIATIIAAMK